MVAYAGTRDGRRWSLAPSLVNLMVGTNAIWPNRDTASDGSIGDAAHAARDSDHNPRLVDGYGGGATVLAVDIDVDLDNDPASSNAPEVSELMAALFAHDATNYVIYDRHIYQRRYRWQPRVYTGTNPHTGHVHISILPTAAAVTDMDPWFPNRTELDDMPYTPQQLTDLIVKPLIDRLSARIDVLEATLTRELNEVPDDILNHRVTAMDPKSGKPSEIRYEEALTRASEATVVRQAAQVTSATTVGRLGALGDIKKMSAAVGTNTAALEALIADTLPDGTIRARDPRTDTPK